ncbi:MAG: tripartite tricarboxylate transporter substrate binding protein [Planctomycetota bacterium]|jgi:tripartite-type tricarboxylate transporter receptor subunit TctC|nr:tripartite tricarboxylate transporter substrate binding protein [Planctomycetota bacterium]
MRIKGIAAVALAVAFAAPPAFGGGFPEKPVEAIVPWSPGGGGDLVFRALAAVFPKYANGQPLLIKNIPGAAGVPGIIEFMKAKPDGYTIAHWNPAQTIKTHMTKTPYTATQFKGVANIVNDTFYHLVAADSPFKTLRDMIDFAKANPGKLTVGNAGTGGGSHFAEVLFEEKAGIAATAVPFQGGGPLVTGILSGQVMAGSCTIPEGASNIKAGQLRILSIYSPERHPFYPDTPTGLEQGIDMVFSAYRGIVAPADTPPETLRALQDIFRKAITDPGFVKQINDIGSNPTFLTGAEYDKIIAQDSENFLKVIKELKMGDIYNK